MHLPISMLCFLYNGRAIFYVEGFVGARGAGSGSIWVEGLLISWHWGPLGVVSMADCESLLSQR